MPRLPRPPPIRRSTQAPRSFSARLWMSVDRMPPTRARRCKEPATKVACSWREFYHGLLRWIPKERLSLLQECSSVRHGVDDIVDAELVSRLRKGKWIFWIVRVFPPVADIHVVVRHHDYSALVIVERAPMGRTFHLGPTAAEKKMPVAGNLHIL